jgi:light-regulated signal transduction histidine kinase (bacteriophytochrome)
LSNCDQEQIHLASSIQPHGELFALDPLSNRIVQCAAPARDAVGKALEDIFPESSALFAKLGSRLPGEGAVHLGRHPGGRGQSFDVVAHKTPAALVVEFEQTASEGPNSFDDVYPQVRDFLNRLQLAASIDEVAQLAAVEVRRWTGFDRALVYRFDEAWNGEVIAEDGNGRLPSYLDHHFPASDIPAQARELYRKNRMRLIADANYAPVPITPVLNPANGQPLDLSYSVLRSVSPVHVEYMRNMGTMASMSISLLKGDRLWGLISCHNNTPAHVPFQVRNACDFVAQMMMLQIAAKEAALLADRRHQLRAVQRRLLSGMAAADHFIDGLVRNPRDLTALTGASGAAVVIEGKCRLVGESPNEADTMKIVDWLAQQKDDLFVTSSLHDVMPDGEAFKDTASGVLAIAISQIHKSYVVWFRPEVLRTLKWGGEPIKAIAPGIPQMHPRKSFETWSQTVRLRATAWHEAETDAAGELRTAIVDIVLRKAEEMAALSERLTESNKELEAFSYSVSHDLRAPFRHIVGYAQLLKKLEGERISEKGNRFIDTIVESAISAGTLVDDLLSFSQMGRATLRLNTVDVGALVEDIRNRISSVGGGGGVQWKVGSLPQARADLMMLQQLFQNLIENAVKFSKDREPPIIEVGFDAGAAGGAYFVRDNGVGFDMVYVDKLFGVFQRLHRVEEFEGTGIGLANVKRIVERHGGKVWAHGELGKGATIFFTLPGVESRTNG